MSTMFQKFLAFFSAAPAQLDAGQPVREGAAPDGMPLAGPTYLRQFAHRLGLEVDDLSPAEQVELKRRLDDSMDFREENYDRLYRGVYQLGHGYSLADAERVSAQISEICAADAAQAYLDYRENSIAAEALMAAASVLQNEGENAAAERLFSLADARRHRSSRLPAALANAAEPADTDTAKHPERTDEPQSPDGTESPDNPANTDLPLSTESAAVTQSIEVQQKDEDAAGGLADLMTPTPAPKTVALASVPAPTKKPKAKNAK